jgi:hypothetical protein
MHQKIETVKMYDGIVKSATDPEGYGRVLIDIPGVVDDMYAVPLFPMISTNSVFFMYPAEGAKCKVIFTPDAMSPNIHTIKSGTAYIIGYWYPKVRSGIIFDQNYTPEKVVIGHRDGGMLIIDNTRISLADINGNITDLIAKAGKIIDHLDNFASKYNSHKHYGSGGVTSSPADPPGTEAYTDNHTDIESDHGVS